MTKWIVFAALLLAGAAWADEQGELNPPEMTLKRMQDRATEGQVDMMVCASGYLLTKKGDHEGARAIFEACAEAGYTGAMTWMSQMDDNGLGAPENPEAATDWSRRAAEAGDPIGQFNYGVAKLRGRGTAVDEAEGRALVDKAAEAGLEIAQRLKGADYDLDEVTPDADGWKFNPKLF